MRREKRYEPEASDRYTREALRQYVDSLEDAANGDEGAWNDATFFAMVASQGLPEGWSL